MRKRLAVTLAAMALTAVALLMLATTAGATNDDGHVKGKNGHVKGKKGHYKGKKGHYKGKQKMVVSGDSKPDPTCTLPEGTVGAIRLTGDLEGCLSFIPKRATCTELNGFALYKEWGREIFEGSWNKNEGTFKTRYKIVGTYRSGSCKAIDSGKPELFPFLDQLTGGCKHKVLYGTGAFRGYRGLLTFHDHIPVVGDGATNFFYEGYLKQNHKHKHNHKHKQR